MLACVRGVSVCKGVCTGHILRHVGIVLSRDRFMPVPLRTCGVHAPTMPNDRPREQEVADHFIISEAIMVV